MKNDAVKQLKDLIRVQLGSRVEVLLTSGNGISGVVAGTENDTLILARAVTRLQGYSFASPIVFVSLVEIVSLTNEGDSI
ncbi:hypothetical protein E2R51_12145 [Jeotgalibacillus sp. S-D1]|uniref:hypothetical protein n=1 Tax=Jeotgalibacillus sp. S-D1 TaxID=2552189 RepID=UPI00105A618F|nr:hypothetical protein [Jeotgalibacillus sp. S-D1]TDL31960.1 hypothetical protein E2R51_12145 [Jeotgalibacillus sp. S-D1]